MSSRIRPVTPAPSTDPAVTDLLQFAKAGFGDTQMFGVLAHRPELLKRLAALFKYFLAGEGGVVEPALLELMRLRGAHLNACTWCATVRLLPVQDQVQGKERALGVGDVSAMTKAQAVDTLRGRLDTSSLTRREALAVQLVDRLVTDPHGVDDAFFAELKSEFRDEEIIEMLIASSFFTAAGAFNTAVRLDTDADSRWKRNLTYATAASR
jgi:alkylhydroperoxidase family enzyme